jgi:hypothetical protein
LPTIASTADDDGTLTLMTVGGDNSGTDGLGFLFAGPEDKAANLGDERPSRPIERAAARSALGRLDEMEAALEHRAGESSELGARALFDPHLMAAKRDLVTYPPVRVRCAGRHHLDWIGLAPLSDHGLQLNHVDELFAPRDRRQGAFGMRSATPMNPSGPGAAIGTVSWVQDANRGAINSQPHQSGTWGDVFALTADYTCPECRCHCKVLHVSLLRLWLGAVIRGDRDVLLGPSIEVPARAERHLQRVADRGSARAWSTRTQPQASSAPEAGRKRKA